MRKAQLISMDLVLGFIIFLFAISVFFYAMGGISFLNKKKTLDVQADFVFNNVENLPNDRINFLQDYKVNRQKLEQFSSILYQAEDKDGDRIRDDKDPSPPPTPTPLDSDGDMISDYEELLAGTFHIPGAVPADTEEDYITHDPVGDGMDDKWEDRKGLDNTAVDHAFEDLNMDSLFQAVTTYLLELTYGRDYDCDGTIRDEPYRISEDSNMNYYLDGNGAVEDRTGFLLDGTQTRCNFLGNTNVWTGDMYPDGDNCRKCVPNFKAYLHDLRKGDFDNDGLSDINELNIYGTSFAQYADSECGPGIDFPGLSDGAKMTLQLLGFNNFVSADGDCQDDRWEQKYGLDTTKICCEKGTPCVFNGFYDFCTWGDPDGDMLSNWEEMKHGTNPMSPDTDGDGFDDLLGYEKPLYADIRSIILGDIRITGFNKVDVCIYIESNTGSILYHIGGGDSPDNMVYVADSQKCGHGAMSVSSPSPQCMTAPFVESIVMSRPVLYEDYSNPSITQLAKMKILICGAR